MLARVVIALLALALVAAPAHAQDDRPVGAEFTVTPTDDGWYRVSMDGVDGAILLNDPSFPQNYPQRLRNMFSQFGKESTLEGVQRAISQIMRELIDAVKDQDAEVRKTRAVAERRG